MKKIALLLICMTAIIACSKKIIPATTQTTAPLKEEKAKSQDDQQSVNDTKKMDDMAKPTEPAPVMTQMEYGKTVFMAKCASCHAMKNPGDFTFAQWENILKTMVPNAKLSAAEEKQVTMYIKANARQ